MAVKGISEVAFSTDLDWAALTGTFTVIPIKSILKEGFGFPDPEEYITKLADDSEDLDGVKHTGTMQVKADEASVPDPADGAHWLRMAPSQGLTYRYFGGVNGATVRQIKAGIRALSDGQWYDKFTFTAAGADSGSVFKDTP